MSFVPKEDWGAQAVESKWRPIETLPSQELTTKEINGPLTIFLSDGEQFAVASLNPPNVQLRWIDTINKVGKQKFFPTHWAYPKGMNINGKKCQFDE